MAIVEPVFHVLGVSCVPASLYVSLIPERHGGVDVALEYWARIAVLVGSAEVVAYAGPYAVPAVRESTSLEAELVEPIDRTVVVVEDVVAVLLSASVLHVLERVVHVRFEDVLPLVVQPRLGASRCGHADLCDAAVHRIAGGREGFAVRVARVAPPGGAISGARDYGQDVIDHERQCDPVA